VLLLKLYFRVANSKIFQAGSTALYGVVQRKRLTYVRLLLNLGANWNHLNKVSLSITVPCKAHEQFIHICCAYMIGIVLTGQEYAIERSSE